MHILVTGTAGFVGFHLAQRLLAEGHTVTGIDALTDYYDVRLKTARHAILGRSKAFEAHIESIEDADALERTVAEAKPEIVIHLAAQSGVRYSIEHPKAYIDTNIIGTFNILEIARKYAPRHLMLASTSSVYGASDAVPLRETNQTDHPLSFYAASKKVTEVMAHSYAHLYRVPTTIFRFFNVYGPWGRPDLALFKFVKAALAGEPIDVYGHGKMARDFTYIDDLIEAVLRLIHCVPAADGRPISELDSLSSVAPFRILNIGGGHPVELMTFIEEIESCLGVRIQKRMLPMQQGDVGRTHASPELLLQLTGYEPSTPVSVGIPAFIAWYRSYYGNDL